MNSLFCTKVFNLKQGKLLLKLIRKLTQQLAMKHKPIAKELLVFATFLLICVVTSSTTQPPTIPKLLWSYSITPNTSFPHYSFTSPFKQFYFLNRLNNIRMAALQNYTVNYVSDKNYSSYLSEESSGKIDRIVELFGKRIHNEEATTMYEQMVNEVSNVTRRLVVYFLMKERGGVFIDDMVTLVEPLDSFIADISTNRDINTGNTIPLHPPPTPICLGFHNSHFSSLKQPIPFLHRPFPTQKHLTKYPNLQDYFIACQPNSVFISRVLQIYLDLLMNESRSEWLGGLDRSERMIGQTRISKVYEQGHVVAGHVVLQERQRGLQVGQQWEREQLAIDYFQLKTLNYRLGPSKLSSQLIFDEYKLISYLTKLTIHQMEVFIGKLRYVFKIDYQLLRLLAERFKWKESETEYVVEGSFVDRFWLGMVKGEGNEKNLQMLGDVGKGIGTYAVMRNANQNNSTSKIQYRQNPLLSPPPCPQCHHLLATNPSTPQWSTLPKTIWIIWDTGISHSNFIVQMSYQNLKLSASNSNFTLNVITKQNVHQFISPQLIQIINNAIANASFDLGNQAISDLWRLALVYEHGGVYLDASTFQVDESFEWILNVTRFPSNLIWNRYGLEPDVFLLWNTYYGGPLDWHFDQEFMTKSQWHLSYESNFIASIPHSKLVKQWLDTMIEWIQLPFNIVEDQMDAVGMKGHSWTHDVPFLDPVRYLTVMDAIKYVVGRKEKYLQQNSVKGGPKTAPQYFKVWSVPGQMIGHLKFRGETNYQNRDYRLDQENKELNNIYRYQYPFSYIQGPLGPALFQVKFFGYDLIYMNKYLNDFYLSNREKGKTFDLKKLENSFHPQSLFSKKILNRFPNKTIECLEKYSQIAEMRTKIKAANKIWTY